jgi:hypothetical protein
MPSEQAQSPLPPTDYEVFEHVIATLRTALNRKLFEQEWMKGSRLIQAGAIYDVLSD